MKVVWLAPYPTMYLEDRIPVTKRVRAQPATWIVNLIDAIKNFTDIELHILSIARELNRDTTIIEENVRYHFITTPAFYWRAVTFFQLDKFRLLRKISQIDPDIVHAHGTEEVYGYVAVRCGRPAVISLQGIISECLQQLEELFTITRFIWLTKRFLEKKALKEGKYYMVRTDWAENIVKRYSADASIFRIWEPMNEAYFQAKRSETKRGGSILFVGHISPLKGIEDLLEGIAILASEFPQVRLKVCGFGTENYVKKLQKRYSNLSDAKIVEFCGFKNPQQLAREMETAAMIVSPSHIDNSPNVICEAMIAGMPVIASAVGGIPSLIEDGETGLLIKARDPKALSEKIRYLIQNPEDACRLGENAMRVARVRHDPEQIARDTYEAYRTIIEESSLGGVFC